MGEERETDGGGERDGNENETWPKGVPENRSAKIRKKAGKNGREKVAKKGKQTKVTKKKRNCGLTQINLFHLIYLPPSLSPPGGCTSVPAPAVPR